MSFPLLISPWCLILLHPPLNIQHHLHGPPETLCFHCSRRKALFWVVVVAKPRFRSLVVPPSKDSRIAENLLCKQKWNWENYYFYNKTFFVCQHCVSTPIYNAQNLTHRFSHRLCKVSFLKSRIKEVLWIFLLLL